MGPTNNYSLKKKNTHSNQIYNYIYIYIYICSYFKMVIGNMGSITFFAL